MSISDEKAKLAAVDPEGPFKVIRKIPQLTEMQKLEMLTAPGEVQKVINRRIKDIDAEVNEIMEQHPTYQRLKAQLAKGLIKYGTPVTPDHYSVYGWFEHLQEESTDKMVYNELMLNKIESAIQAVTKAISCDTLEANNMYLEQALEILIGSKEGNL